MEEAEAAEAAAAAAEEDDEHAPPSAVLHYCARQTNPPFALDTISRRSKSDSVHF